MLRVILFMLLLFALPFAAYAAWVWLRRQPLGGGVFDDAPNLWLAVAGLVFAIAGFLAFADFDRGGTEGVYVPPHMEDGKIVPGRLVRPEEAAGE